LERGVKIGQAADGQARTLRDRSYEQRMREFVELAHPLL